MEDALKRLDKLTQEEARMAIAEILKLTHDITNGNAQSAIYSENLILNLSAVALVRRKRNETKGSIFGKRRRRH